MKNCLIIPIHPPKSNWLISFLNSALFRRWASGMPYTEDDLDFDLVLAVSTYGDFVFFENIFNSLKLNYRIRFFIVDSYVLDTLRSSEILKRLQANTDGCVVGLKKLLALHWAHTQGYEWALCMDSDSIVINDIGGLFDLAIKNYNSRKYFGSSGNGGTCGAITTAIVQKFPESRHAELSTILKGQSFYSWFFDIPCYNVGDVQDFFVFMSQQSDCIEAWLATINWWHFDHFLFSCWRLLSHDCKVIDYAELGIPRIPENLTGYDLIRINDAYDYCPAWISSLQLFLEPGIVRRLPNLRIGYHFDRMTPTS